MLDAIMDITFYIALGVFAYYGITAIGQTVSKQEATKGSYKRR